MTKPTLLPGGCSQKRGVDFQVFHSHFRGVAFLIIALLGVISSQAADVRLYTVTKGTRHFQTNDLGPRFLPVDEFIFEARVLSTASNLITSARVQSLTDGPVQILTKQDPMEWEYDADANNLHDLNVAFPDGNYRYNILTTNDDRSIVTLSLSGSFPSSPHTNAPHILNYNELQSASGTGFVQVIWAPFTNGTRSDSIQLRVEDRQGNRVFETRDFDEPGALDGTATSAIIEPGNLQPGKTYDAWLEFRNTTDLNTTAYPGAIGWAYKHRRTEFTIKTPTNSSILDLESYVVCKGHSYIQTNLNGPFLEGLSNNAFVFSASLESTQPNLIISNLFIAPNDQTFIASREDCRPDEQFEYSAVTSSQTGLDNQFPNGDYQIRVRTTNQGLRSMSLTLAGTNYPPAPWILNFDPSIPVRTTNAIEIRWKQWVGGTANDFIQLRLLNGCSNVFETGDFGDNDALNGYATNTIIPADVMKPSITYRATLVFRRYSDLDFASNPGAAGIACLFSRTRFDVTALLDVQAIDLAKGSNYVQTNFVSVVPDGTNANEFFAVVDAQFPDSVTAATVDLPDFTPLPLLPAAPGDDEFAHSALSSNSLDTTYPPGRYVFKVWTTNDGFHTVPLSLSPLSYPPPPRFLHDPTNRVPHDQTNQIVWSAWTGGTTNDFIQLRIRNAGTNVWETPDFGEEGALNGTATTAYIPANALTRGENYNAQLIFRRTTDTNTTAYPGSLALAYYFSQTEMDLRTIAPDIEDYEIEKGISFVQVSSTEIVSEPGQEFLFNAQVQGSATGLISRAILTIPTVPDVTVSNMTPTDDTLEQYEVSDVADTNDVFEAKYPAGVYQFEVVTQNDGMQRLELSVANAVYPPVPRISNFTFNTNSPLAAGPPIALEWDPWLGGTTNDFIQVQVRDSGTNVWETPNFGDPGALNGLSTNAVIPDGALLPGKNYSARVIFRRFTLFNQSVPGTDGTVSFFTRTKFDISTYDPDVRDYRLFKGVEARQTDTNTLPPLEYVIEAVFIGRTDPEFQLSTLLGVQLTPPGRDPVDLVRDEDDDSLFTLPVSFATPQELDDAFPNGPYVITIDGTRYGLTNFTVYLTNDIPNIPRIVNYAAAGRIVASQPFTLQWDPFIGGTVTDYITNVFVSAAGTNAYSTPPPEDPAALNGLRTETTLNQNTLRGNAIYDASLRFEKVSLNDSTTLVEVPGRAGSYSRTAFRAVTVGAGNPPRFSARLLEFVPPNRVQFVVATIPGGAYSFEGSTNLVNWNLITNITAETEFYTNSVVRPGPEFFIRGSLLR